MSVSSWIVESTGVNGKHVVTEKRSCDDSDREDTMTAEGEHRWSEFESDMAVTRAGVIHFGDDSTMSSLDVSQRSSVFDEDPKQYKSPQRSIMSASAFDRDTAVPRRKRTVGDDSMVSSRDMSLKSNVYYVDPKDFRRSDWNKVSLSEFENDTSARRKQAGLQSLGYDRSVSSKYAIMRSGVPGEDPNQYRQSREKQFGQQPSVESFASISEQELFDTFQAWDDSSLTPDSFLKSDKIHKLDLSNFSDFIRGMEKALVMFYLPESCDTLKLGFEFSKAADRSQQENHAFAAVDCSANTRLCFREKAVNLPVLKLYSNGFDLSTVNDVKKFKADQMQMLVKMTPVLNQPREALAKKYLKRR